MLRSANIVAESKNCLRLIKVELWYLYGGLETFLTVLK
jgi:hypothetical protein